MNIIFLGAPGAGKGTQAARVAEELKLAHIASGDLFRQAQAGDSHLSLEVKSYMEKGALVPDEITIRMILERISAPDCEVGVVFDGFPRTLKQAKALDESLGEQAKIIDKVVYIKVAELELLERLSGRWVCRQCQVPYHALHSPPNVEGRCDQCGGDLYQRTDDVPETIKNRLQVYFVETAPLIDYYIGAGKLLQVDGEGAVDEIKQRIVDALRQGVGSLGER